MTELERWMNDHPPLADALTAEETAAAAGKKCWPAVRSCTLCAAGGWQPRRQRSA